MKVIVTSFAQQQIYETASYIQQEFGKVSRRIFMQKVREAKRLLADNPHMGSIEPNLAGLSTTYHSIVVARLNKIIYCIESERIEIVDLWDVRREPETLASQVKGQTR